MSLDKDSYQQAADQLFSVPRSLADGTPVTGRSPGERLLLIKLMTDLAGQAGQPGFLGCYEFDRDTNPYVALFVCWYQLLKAQAEVAGKRLVFVATNGMMSAKAQNNSRSLMSLIAMEFITWGDLTKISNRKPELLKDCFFIGDLDFEPENKLGALMSSDGMVKQGEIVQKVHSLARNARTHILFFHRTGWKSPFQLDELAKVTRSEKSDCFIATAACGTSDHPQVEILRSFRDQALAHSTSGRLIMRLYDRLSPPLADWIRIRPLARHFVRQGVIRPAAWGARVFMRDG